MKTIDHTKPLEPCFASLDHVTDIIREMQYSDVFGSNEAAEAIKQVRISFRLASNEIAPVIMRVNRRRDFRLNFLLKAYQKDIRFIVSKLSRMISIDKERNETSLRYNFHQTETELRKLMISTKTSCNTLLSRSSRILSSSGELQNSESTIIEGNTVRRLSSTEVGKSDIKSKYESDEFKMLEDYEKCISEMEKVNKTILCHLNIILFFLRGYCGALAQIIPFARALQK